MAMSMQQSDGVSYFTELIASGNFLDNGGLKALSETLSYMTGLQRLDFSNNKIDLCPSLRPKEDANPLSVKVIGWQNGNTKCEWFKKEYMYSYKYARTARKFDTLVEAQRHCIILGPNECRAVTCKHNRTKGDRVTTGKCSVRFQRVLAHSHPDAMEETYVPAPICYQENVFGFLTHTQSLDELRLSQNRLCSLGLAEITKYLASLHRLRKLDVSSTHIGHVDEALLHNFSDAIPDGLLKLNISDNNFGMHRLLAFTDGAHKFPKLKLFHASKTGLKPTDNYTQLGLNLGRFPELESLSLDDNHIGDAGLATFGSSLSNMNQLCDLTLRNTRITGFGLQAFTQNFPASYVMRKINIADNQLGVEGLKAALSLTASTAGMSQKEEVMRRALSFNHRNRMESKLSKCFITSVLDLTNTSLGRGGAEHLAYVAAETRSLRGVRHLRLSHNGMGVSTQVLLNAFHKLDHLRELRLAGNDITVDTSSTSNTSLLSELAGWKLNTLDWSYNEATLQDLANILEKGKFWLRHIYLRGSFRHYNDPARRREGRRFLFPDLSGTWLMTLDLGWNNFSFEEMEVIFRQAAGSKRLETLIIDGNEFNVQVVRQVFEESGIPSLKELRGDFTSCQAQTLRTLIPRAEIVSTAPDLALTPVHPKAHVASQD